MTLNQRNSDLVAELFVRHTGRLSPPNTARAATGEIFADYLRLVAALAEHREREQRLMAQITEHLARFFPDASAASDAS